MIRDSKKRASFTWTVKAGEKSITVLVPLRYKKEFLASMAKPNLTKEEYDTFMNGIDTRYPKADILDRIGKQNLIWGGVVTFFLIFIASSQLDLSGYSSGSSNTPGSSTTQTTETTKPAPKKKKPVDKKKKLNDILTSINEFKVEPVTSIFDAGNQKTKFYNLKSDVINYRDENDPENMKLYEKVLNTHAKKLQLVLKDLRKGYVKFRANDLWKDDFKVTCSGDCKTITYINWRFAANAQIQDFHDDERSYLKELEFTRVNYKWIDYGEYTSYNLK
ncbi:MAG: hypothetical protein MH137_11225 [Flavobacteriales bacterium]|nr:hypothetical protein [Flavobacteriales bacterium]